MCYVNMKQNGSLITRMRFLHSRNIEWYTEMFLYEDAFFYIKTVVETQTSDYQLACTKMDDKNTYIHVLLLLNIIAVFSYCTYFTQCLMYQLNQLLNELHDYL